MAGNKMGQTVTVVNQSGKIIKESKHLVNVFKEARAAYRERKAEIKAVRDVDYEQRKAERALKVMTIDDEDAISQAPSKTSRTPSRVDSKSGVRRSKTHHHHHHSRRPPAEQGISNSFFENDGRGNANVQEKQLARRHTEALIAPPKKPSRRHSDDNIDMDLAYGDLPPPLPVARREDEEELRVKASKLTMLLDEANCLQYSVTTMIENLQKNPDALAAVALTLAEISGLVSKLAPGVLGSLKASFPAVVALLASPQFLIAAGVGVGLTVVSLGGFKVIKKIKAEKEAQKELESPLELDELNAPELSRIELWRRGIADVEADSNGTTVDGEFVTPGASRHLIAEGILEDDRKFRKPMAPKSVRSTKTSKTSRTAKTAKSTHSSHSRSVERSGEKKKTKPKQPGGLRMLFS